MYIFSLDNGFLSVKIWIKYVILANSNSEIFKPVIK